MATKIPKYPDRVEITTNERKMEETIISRQTPEKSLYPVRVEHAIATKTRRKIATKTPKHKKDIKNSIRLDKYFRALVLLWRSLCSQSNSIFRAFVFSWLLYCSQSIKAFRVLVLSWLSFRYWAPLNKKLNLTTK